MFGGYARRAGARCAAIRRRCASRRAGIRIRNRRELMHQFLSVLGWEIGYYLRRLSTWVYFGIYALVGFLFMLLSGGAFRQASAVFGGGGQGVAHPPLAPARPAPANPPPRLSPGGAGARNPGYRHHPARVGSRGLSPPRS